MRRALISIVLAIVGCAFLYALIAKRWADNKEMESPVPAMARLDVESITEPLELDEDVAGNVEDTTAETDGQEVAVDPEEEPTHTPHIQWNEYPGRRMLLQGVVSTGEERRKITEIFTTGLPKEWKIDNQLKLDHQCEPFTEIEKLQNLNLQAALTVRLLECHINDQTISLKGTVPTGAAKQRLLAAWQQSKPQEWILEEEVGVEAAPSASISVWMSPDRTSLVSGTVPEGMGQHFIKLFKASVPAGVLVIDDLIEDRFVASPAWLERFEKFLPLFLQQTQRSGLRIDKNNHVRVEGVAKGAAIASLKRQLTDVFPPPTYEIAFELQLGMASNQKVETVKPDQAAPKALATYDDLIRNAKIYFRSGNVRVSRLAGKERAKIDQIGLKWSQENRNRKIYLFGFTDPSGDRGTNEYFAKTRCDNVALYLKREFGIPEDLLEVIGMPKDYKPSGGSPSEMRRVEFSFNDQPSAGSTAPITLASAPKTVLKPVSLRNLVSTTKIFFTSKQVTPSKDDRKVLEAIAGAMVLEKPEEQLVVFAYSDGKGSANANKWFTEERCKAVAGILTRFGVPREQIVLQPVIKAKSSNAEPKEPKASGSLEDKDEAARKNAKDGNEETEVNERRVEFALIAKPEPIEKEEPQAQPDNEVDPEAPEASESPASPNDELTAEEEAS